MRRLLVVVASLVVLIGSAMPPTAIRADVLVRPVAQPSLPVAIASAEWLGTDTLRVAVENRAAEPVHSLSLIAVIVRPDGHLAGYLSQPLGPAGGGVPPLGRTVGSLVVDAIPLPRGGTVLVAISRLLTSGGAWAVPPGGAPLAGLGTIAPAGGDGLPLVRTNLPEAAGSESCGAGWCASEREACKQICAGAKGIASFTCSALQCYSQCVCQW